MSALYDAGPQAGGRRPAPGRLGLVQAFLNSRFDLLGDPSADLFSDADGLARWMTQRGLRAGRLQRADVDRTVTVREGLRAALASQDCASASAGALADAAKDAVVSFAVDATGRTAPAAVGSGVPSLLGLVLAAGHEAQATGVWERLKVCPAPHCGWVFYDHSRNRSSQWCSMDVCGGREKARAYRRRSREH